MFFMSISDKKARRKPGSWVMCCFRLETAIHLTARDKERGGETGGG
jgi:hypothetical protein